MVTVDNFSIPLDYAEHVLLIKHQIKRVEEFTRENDWIGAMNAAELANVELKLLRNVLRSKSE